MREKRRDEELEDATIEFLKKKAQEEPQLFIEMFKKQPYYMQEFCKIGKESLNALDILSKEIFEGIREIEGWYNMLFQSTRVFLRYDDNDDCNDNNRRFNRIEMSRLKNIKESVPEYLFRFLVEPHKSSFEEIKKVLTDKDLRLIDGDRDRFIRLLFKKFTYPDSSILQDNKTKNLRKYIEAKFSFVLDFLLDWLKEEDPERKKFQDVFYGLWTNKDIIPRNLDLVFASYEDDDSFLKLIYETFGYNNASYVQNEMIIFFILFLLFYRCKEREDKEDNSVEEKIISYILRYFYHINKDNVVTNTRREAVINFIKNEAGLDSKYKDLLVQVGGMFGTNKSKEVRVLKKLYGDKDDQLIFQKIIQSFFPEGSRIPNYTELLLYNY